ncbi:lipid droplet-associated hydrolase-like [Styela clava]
MASDIMTTYEWVCVDGIPLHTIKCGQWKLNTEEKSLFLIIPGNPGSIGFYQNFSEALFKKTGVPVWGISHTGHASIPEEPHHAPHHEGQKVGHPETENCGLSPQIYHKIRFLESEVLPKVDEVFLVGHSIGCYIILHILDKMDDPKLRKGIMLFPTIERMAVTPKGKWLTPFLIHGQSFVSIFAWMLTFLPHFVKKRLVEYLFRRDEEVSRNTVLNHVIHPKVAKSCMYMAMQEMQLVHERDDHIIEAQMDKLVFYYGAIDHWCPVSYYEDLKKAFQNINARLCENNYIHAFVLQHSKELADIVSDMLKSDFQTTGY